MPPITLPGVGTFTAKIYPPHDRQYDASNPAQTNRAEMTDREVGAKILLEFTPDANFARAAGNTISLVQTMRETIAKRTRLGLGQQGAEDAYLLRENYTAGFPLRTVTDGSGDAGWTIDHQLFIEQKGVTPGPTAQAAATVQYTAARADAILQLAAFPAELALVQGTPQAIAFVAGAGVQAGRQVSTFKATPHRRDLQLVISRLRSRPQSAAQQAVQSVRSMLQYEYATRNTIALQNLDPRYAELRTNVGAPRKARPAGNLNVLRNPMGDSNRPADPNGGDLLLGHTFNAECNGAAWTTAALSDEPTAPFKKDDTLAGGMEFEVAALLETAAGQRRFIGSVTWGWRMDQNDLVELSPPALSLGDGDSASPAFIKAAQRWNAMIVPDVANNATLRPVVALPTADREFALLDRALKGDDKEAITRARDLVLATWRQLSDTEKAQSDSRLLDLLDRYEMKVNGRRPSQLALRDEYKF